MVLTFFCFDILKLTDTFITNNWGNREDTQKVLVAICTLEYFSWLYTLIFVQMFFYLSSSLEPLFFSAAIEHNFSDHPIEVGKIFWDWKRYFIRHIPVLPQTTANLMLNFKLNIWEVATIIWYSSLNWLFYQHKVISLYCDC